MYRNIYFIGPIYTEFIQNELHSSNWMSCIGGNIGNVAIMLGNERIIKVHCISRISNDTFGKNIREILKSNRINTKCIQEDQQYKSDIIFVDIFKKTVYEIEHKCYEKCVIPNFLDNNKPVIIYFNNSSLKNEYLCRNIANLCLTYNNLSIFDLSGTYQRNNKNLIDNFIKPNINIYIGKRDQLEQLVNLQLPDIIKNKNNIFRFLNFFIVKDYEGYKYSSKTLDILIPIDINDYTSYWDTSVFIAAILNYIIQKKTEINFENKEYIYEMFNYANINTCNHNSKYLQK